jgi:hypothetical protein
MCRYLQNYAKIWATIHNINFINAKQKNVLQVKLIHYKNIVFYIDIILN